MARIEFVCAVTPNQEIGMIAFDRAVGDLSRSARIETIRARFLQIGDSVQSALFTATRAITAA